MFWLKNTHSIKTGFEALHTAYTGLFQQKFRGIALLFSSGPSNFNSIFPVWNNPSTWNIGAISPLAVSYVQGFGNFNIDVPTNSIGGWAQDDWKVNSHLTLNLGLRYDNDLGIFDPNLHLTSGVQTPHYNDN